MLLALDISIWGTGTDLTICLRNGGCDWQTIANRTATYFNSFGSGFNMVSFSPLDRDAAYYMVSSGSNRWWWDDDSREPKFSTMKSWLGSIIQQTNKRAIMWQVPNGNRQYLTENNTDGHYQDNRTEYFLNANSGRQHIQDWIDIGVVGLMWGAGAGGQSHYWDSKIDGITNPGTISNGNPMGIATSLTSTVSDDDGGYIRQGVGTYYTQGALPLTPGNTTPTIPGPTNTPFPTPTSGPTPTQSPIQTIDFDTNIGGHTVEAPLNGQYPTSVIDWGTNSWYLSGAYNVDSTNSVTFNGAGVTSAVLNFVSPRKLVSIKAFGNSGTTVTINCPDNSNNPTITSTTIANQWNVINTNWSQTCSQVRIQAGNGWTTNFDDMVISTTIIPSPTLPISTPTPTRTPTPPVPTPTRTPTPTGVQQPTPTPTSAPNTSWTGQYYNSKTPGNSLRLTRTDPVIDFNWSGSPGPNVRSNNFSVRWTKTQFFTGGVYTITTRHDDGMRIWIDNTQVYNYWFDQGAVTRTTSVNIGAGNHTIKVEMYDSYLNAVAYMTITP